MQSLFDMVGSHPSWALAAVFLVAFAESLAVVGTLVPAVVVMFGAGALVSAGSLDLWTTLAVAATGAVLGDALSYELGRSQEARIRGWGAFQRHEDALAKGEAFIRRHGGKSILLARFTGPMRAFVPLLAGFSHMARTRFYAVNILSACLWAPAHILPGVVLGASLQVAEAVSGRLAVMALLLAGLMWIVVRVTSLGVRIAMPRLRQLRDAALEHGRGRHSLMAGATRALLDPQRPGSQALLLGAVLLLTAGWLFLGVLEDVIARDQLVQADVAVFHFLQGLRTAAVDRIMIVSTEMGAVGVMLPLVLVVALWLLWHRCWRTAAYWLGVAAFAEVLVTLLKYTLGRHRPRALYSGAEAFSFPSGHAVFSMVVMGFLAFLLAHRQTLRTRLVVASVCASYAMLVAFSRLYLGAHWLSDVLGGMSLGVAWVALAAMVYTQRAVQEEFRPRALAIVVLAALPVLGAVEIGRHSGTDAHLYRVEQPALEEMGADAWRDHGWQQLPARRFELSGDLAEAFNLQWACNEQPMRESLDTAGWHAAPAWSVQSSLGWIAPHRPLADLPVLPRLDRGTLSRLDFVRPTGQPGQRDVLRLWDSGVRIQGGQPGSAQPVWYGAVYRESRLQVPYLPSPGVRSTAREAGMAPAWPADVAREIASRPDGQPDTSLLRCPE